MHKGGRTRIHLCATMQISHNGENAWLQRPVLHFTTGSTSSSRRLQRGNSAFILIEGILQSGRETLCHEGLWIP